jgi:hypothetical protein
MIMIDMFVKHQSLTSNSLILFDSLAFVTRALDFYLNSVLTIFANGISTSNVISIETTITTKKEPKITNNIYHRQDRLH